MAEATQTAQDSGTAQQTEQPAVQQTELSFDDRMSAAVKSGNMEEMQKIGAEIRAPKEEAKDTPAIEVEKGKEEAASDKKLFTVKYRGSEKQLDDNNGLLGYDNTGALKKAFAHQKYYIGDLEDRSEQNRLQAEAKAAENETLKKQLEELKQAAQQTVTPEKKEETVVEIQKVDRPTFPVQPVLSTNDPLDYTDDDRKALEGYNQDIVEYNKQMDGYLDYLENRPVQVAENPEIEQIKSELNATKQVIDKFNESQKNIDQEKADFDFWTGISKFQDAHSELFGTSKPIADLHKDVEVWMDRLTQALGSQKPLTPYNPNEVSWQNYEAAKANNVRRFLDGDQEIVQNAEGVSPPEGYENYFKVADIQKAKDRLVSEGILGKNASLEEAYLMELRNNGDLDSGISEVQQTSVQQGIDAMSDAIKQQELYATTIPNNIASESTPSEVSQEDYAWYLNVSKKPQELASNKESLKRYQEISVKLGLVA